jgi:PiT family inorganic phosphate transporter
MRAFRRSSPERVNRGFARVQVGSSLFASVMHGSNDGQKFVGIITALLIGAAWLPAGATAPFWVLLAAFGTVSLGTLLGGWRIVKTLAVGITDLKPYQGVAAEGGGALILAATAATGSPVSTTHAFTAAIMGVGATRRLSAVRWGLARRIVLTWIVTMPTAAAFAFGTYLLLSLPYGWVVLAAALAAVIGSALRRRVLLKRAAAQAAAAIAAGAPRS